MIALLATVALVAAPQSGPTARQMGHASVYAGLCSSLGWVSSQDQIVAQAQIYLDGHPEQTDAQVEVLISGGVEAANAEIEGMLAAFRASRDAAALKTSLREACNATARDLPSFLARAADTDAQFEVRIAKLLGDL
ncbi:hypothetical protein [Brevundimonas sp. FT23042]|uniref:hypothetical protein n=1 Tax=Brevundimonas sp. FT23042 TaxID=3393749 RepID=UPI003B589680